MLNDPRDSIRGVFLLILAIAGGFTAETLGCRSRKLLYENMLAKHITSFSILYFSIGVFSSVKVDPYENLKKTFLIYTLFILFTRMNLYFTIIVFFLFGVNFIIWNYIDFYKSKNDDKFEQKINNLIVIQNKIFYFLILFIVIGFTLYFKEQYNANRGKWSTIDFIFGTKKCKSYQ